MAKLKFIEDSDEKTTEEAVGMYSKDGEYVNFDEPCVCVGQVYNYCYIIGLKYCTSELVHCLPPSHPAVRDQVSCESECMLTKPHLFTKG